MASWAPLLAVMSTLIFAHVQAFQGGGDDVQAFEGDDVQALNGDEVELPLGMTQADLAAWANHGKKAKAKYFGQDVKATTKAPQVVKEEQPFRALFKPNGLKAPTDKRNGTSDFFDSAQTEYTLAPVQKPLAAGFQKLRALKAVYDDLPHAHAQKETGLTPTDTTEGTSDFFDSAQTEYTLADSEKPGLTNDFQQGARSKVGNFLERVRQARKDRLAGAAPHISNWEVALASVKKPLRVAELRSYQQMEKDQETEEKLAGQPVLAAEVRTTVQMTPDDESNTAKERMVLAAKANARKDILGRTNIDDLKAQATESTERLVEKMIPVMRQGVDDYKRGVDWYSKQVDSWMRKMASDKETKVEYDRATAQ